MATPNQRRSAMAASLPFVLGTLLALAAGVGIVHQRTPRGRRRDVLSVVLVVLTSFAVFVLCFGLGSFVKMLRPQ